MAMKRITDRVVLDVLEAVHRSSRDALSPATPDAALSRRYGAGTVRVITGQLSDRGLVERAADGTRAPTDRGLAVLAAQRPGAVAGARAARGGRAPRHERRTRTGAAGRGRPHGPVGPARPARVAV
ncbi:MAG: hypothetical protein QOF29_3243 [bacterium]